MSEMKTHWKKLVNTQWLGSWDFEEGKDIIATIKLVKTEEVAKPTGEKEICPVLYFEQELKPMVLNRTNAKVIEQQAQSPYIEDWTGLKIQIGVSEVSAFGQTVPALRVRKIKTDRADILK